MKKRILSLLLALIMLVTVFPAGMEAEAASLTDTEILKRADTLTQILNQKYFNVHQNTECGKKSSGHGCTYCDTANIFNAQWFKNAFGTVSTSQVVSSGRSCVGFAWFACWYLLRADNTDSVKNRDVVGYVSPINQSTVSAKARVGDYMYINDCHALVYLGCDATGVQVIDCNGTGTYNCQVTRRTIAYKNLSKLYLSRPWSTKNGRRSDPTPAAAGKTSTPTVSVNGQSVTVSWTYSGSATYFDVYLLQSPWSWYDIKYSGSVGASGRSYTFTGVAPGEYRAFTIARPNLDSVQSGWSSFINVAAPHTHTWNSGVVTTPPTETSTGVKTYTCTGCGATRTEILDKLPHTHKWDEGKVTKEATFDSTGTYTYTCTGCGTTKTEEIPILTTANGKCGDNVFWSYDDTTKTLTLSGTGPTYNYSDRSGPFAGNIDHRVKTVVISPGITTIGDGLFGHFWSATSVSIPTSVEYIGSYAFCQWSSITSITIPSKIIGDRAFGESIGGGPQTVILTEGVSKIGNGAFDGCPNLRYLYIPKSLKDFNEDSLDWYWLKEIWYAGSESDWLMLNPQSLGLWEKVIIHFAETYSAQLSFSDVSSSAYYYDAVKWAVANDITSGTDKTHFSPDAGCTRAQAVTFLWRAAGKPEPQSTTSAFIDVKAGSYYEKAVQWAVEQKIVSGTSATTFSPDTTCTRAQIVTFLWRKEGSPKVSGGSFSDVPEEAYYTDAVKWAVANGITRGTDKTHFSPNNKCTRGQIVSFLYRYGK